MTLTEFLENTGASLRFYDMGRRVVSIDRDTFAAFEQTELPYPYPMQQQAWFALVQTLPDGSREPVIWFLRLKLDEQGKLVQATRDYFLHRFAELASTDTARAAPLDSALDDNPFTFRPRDDRMAVLHARLSRVLGNPPSQYYSHARDYLSGAPGWEQWSFVGYQGIADVAARVRDEDNEALLSAALPHLPDEPLTALCHCLEHERVSDRLAQALMDRLNASLQATGAEPTVLAALIRSLSQAPAEYRDTAVKAVMQRPEGRHVELAAAIGGRAWEALRSPPLARAYLENLAAPDVDPEVFAHCVSDLLRVPGMQQRILDVVRAPDRSGAVADAFQRLTGNRLNQA